MAEVFERLRELLRGSVLLLNDLFIAVQVLYRAEAPGWLSVEYINGGVDPQTPLFFVLGSVLSYLNTQAAWEDARERWATGADRGIEADLEYYCN